MPRECPCGSGKEPDRLYDARGIYCCLYCPDGEKAQKSKYRADVLTNPNYDCDEQIDPD